MAKSNRKLKIVPTTEAPVEAKAEVQAEAKAKEAKQPAKATQSRAEKSQWKVDLKIALFENPKLTNDDLAKLVMKDGFPSRASVDHARAETLHTLGVLKEQKLYAHPGI